VVSSSSSSIYSTADEDFETPTEDESDTANIVEEPFITATKAWITGTKKESVDSNNDPTQLKSMDVSNLQSTSIIKNSNSFTQSRKKYETDINSGSPNWVNNNVSDVSEGSSRFRPGISVVSTDDEEEFRSLDSLFTEGRPITVHELQAVFDCFKSSNLSPEECVSF